MKLETNDRPEDELEVEVNEKQAIFLEAVYNSRFKIAAMIGGRGSGKSVTLSDFLLLASDDLPRAKCGWGVPTIKKAKSKLTSGLKAGWKRHGITEYDFKTGAGCFVLWREPPAHFERPFEAPDIWENCISFPNGFVIEFESFKMAAAENRGANYDLYVIDEGLNFKKEWLKVVLPTLRANVGKFSSTFHQMLAVFSSPPWDLAGQWMYDIEALSKTEPGRYFFLEVKTRDNLAFLPDDYLDTLQKNLTKLEYEVEVEGKRLSKMPHNFYPSFQHHIHVIKEESDEYEARAAWSGELLYNTSHRIEASLDFNAHFTSATLWQSDYTEARLIDNLYCKEPGIDADGVAMTMAQTLATLIATEYVSHKTKQITLTGDRNGKNKSAGSTKSMFDQVAEILEASGWHVSTQALNFNPPHIDKFKDLNNVFAERNTDLIRVRVDGIRCKATVISMDNSPLNTDYTKSKRSESSKVDQELATHLSDTVDYYILWKLKGGRSLQGGGDFDLDYF
ncbi:terminase large subunit domain-containing protein [Spirosoma spitsbergense]|uniref:terminase large subunit domain-containing protein n=1 Tax=Spirosoma spitsbergense TaxID=431554 RepID=UPI00037EA335|nr:terminase family protein [Spirosoma spitsbergense]